MPRVNALRPAFLAALSLAASAAGCATAGTGAGGSTPDPTPTPTVATGRVVTATGATLQINTMNLDTDVRLVVNGTVDQAWAGAIISTALSGTGKNPITSSSAEVRCASKGDLELRIREMVEKALQR